MCLLILKKPGIEIPEENLKEGFRCNACGAGFGWFDPVTKKYYLNKGHMTYPEFINAYRQCITKDVTAIVHFRIATHGLRNADNTHPHWIDGGWLMGHNGVIQETVQTGTESDTVSFARDELTEFVKRNPECIKDKGIQDLISARIGLGNKLVFLNASGEYIIINEQQGHWKDGVWYSNNSYHIPRYNKGAAVTKAVATSCPTSIKDDKVASEFAELYEELVEIDIADGCCICKEKVGSAKSFQYNQYTGKCYCNDCVYSIKSSLLFDNTPTTTAPAVVEKDAELSTEQEAAKEAAMADIEREYDAAEEDDLAALRRRVEKINAVSEKVNAAGHSMVTGNELFPAEEDDKAKWESVGGGKQRLLLEDKTK